MKRKILFSLIICVLCLAVCLTALADEPETPADLSWNISDEGVLTLSVPEGTEGAFEMADYDDTNPPPWAEAETTITSVIIGEGFSSVGANAFSGIESLTEVQLPESMTTISESAFAGTGLTEITLPASVATVGTGAIPATAEITCGEWSYLQNQGGAAVTGWTGTGDNVTVPDNLNGFVMNAVDSAFSGSSANLTGITLPASVTTVGTGAIPAAAEINCGEWSYLQNQGGAAVTGWTGTGDSITVPENLNGFAMNAVDSAFSGSSAGLTEITLPDSIMTIGAGAIPAATEITNGEWRYIQNSGGAAIIGWTGEGTTPEVAGALNGQTVNAIDAAFSGSSANLTGITLPVSVTSIGAGAIPETTEITTGDWTYLQNETGATVIAWSGTGDRVTVPGTLNGIPVNTIDPAFGTYSAGLTEITLPGSVTAVGEGAIPAATTIITGDWHYLQTDDGAKVTGWTGAEQQIAIPEGLNGFTVTEIGESAMAGKTGLQGVTIPETVTAIGSNAFNGDTALGGIVIPDSVTDIGNHAFAGNTSLYDVTIGSGVTSIGEGAFQGDTSLTHIYLPDTVETIGSAVFKNTGLTAARLPAGLTEIPDQAFENAHLNLIILPDTVTSISNNAFRNNEANEIHLLSDHPEYEASEIDEIIYLGTNHLPASLESIGSYAFAGNYLSDVTLPSLATTVGYQGFDNTVTVTSDAATCEWIYRIYGANITVIGWNGTAEDLTVPDDINALHVTAFGNRVFYNKTFLKTVVLPDDTESMGTELFRGCTVLTTADLGNRSAILPQQCFFGCRKLTEVTLPPALTTIDKYAFGNCVAFTEVTVPYGVISIADSAFQGCANMTAIELPSTIEQIGNNVFFNCNSLLNITLPDSLTTLGSGVFTSCSALTNVTIGTGLTTIESDTFQGLPNLKNLVINGSNTFISGNAFSNCGALQTVQIQTATVSSGAFGNCTGLKTFSMQGGTIPDPAFSGCILLETVTLGDDVTYIPDYAFYDLPSLKTVSLGRGITNIPYGAFNNCPKLQSLTLGSRVTDIDSYAFSGCSALTTVNFPSTLNNIGTYAFSGCSGLTSIRLPANMTQIAEGAFSGCSGLTSITFGGAVTTIGKDAFSSCTGLTTITIPYGVTTISEGAFSGCSTLAEAYISDSVQTVGQGAFPTTTRVYCNPTSQAAISISKNGGSFVSTDNPIFGIRLLLDGDISLGISVEQIWAESNEVVIPEYIGGETVTEVGRNALASCPEVTEVTFPASVPVIPEGLCSGNTSLVTVVIPMGVTGIGDGAFENCTKLAHVSLPASLTTIGANAFSGCEMLAEVRLSDHLQSVGENAFTHTKVYAGLDTDTAKMLSRSGGGFVCEQYPLLRLRYVFVGGEAVSLEVIGADETAVNLSIPEGVSSIAEHAFEDRTNLKTVTLPSTLQTIGSYAFAGSGITAITLPEGVTEIPDYAFYNTSGMTTFAAEGVITDIGEYAFSESAVRSVSFAQGLRTVGHSAFRNARSLISANLPDSVTEMGEYAFEGAVNLTHFDVPASMTQIPYSAFNNATALETVTIPTGVVTIRGYAFSNSGLASLELPSTVKEIYYSAFENCKGLLTVRMSGNMDFIESSAFRGCERLRTITMPATLRMMGSNALSGCKSLTDVTLPAGLNELPSNVFSNCTGLTHVKVGDGTISIGSYAFNYCSKLESVELPNSLVRIERYAFYESGITSLTIPRGVTTIEERAFYFCQKLQEIVIPDSVVSLGEYAFAYNYKLAKLHISSGLVSIPSDAFYYNSDLTSVSIPDGVRSIGSYAFAQSYKLESVLIPNSVTSIDETAFEYVNTSKFTVYCFHGSEADSFAQGKGYNIIYLDGEDALEGLTIEPAESGDINIGIGHTLENIDELFVILPEDIPCDFEMVYYTRDEDIATADSDAKTLTGVSAGTTKLVAAFAENPEIYAEITVHVRENIADFRLTDPIWQKREENLDLNTIFVDPATAIDGYAWTVDRSLGTIENNVLFPTAFGSGTLEARSWNGIVRSSTIHIYEDPTEIRFVNVPAGMDIGGTTVLEPRVKAGTIFTGDEALHFITYTSANENIATVAADGTVTATGYGTTEIIATAENGTTGTAKINVSPVISSFEIQGRVLAPIGATFELRATEIEPADANPNAFVWTSDPAGLVSYENGYVTVLTDQECEVTISATTWDGGLTKETKLTIFRPDVEEVSIQPVNEWNWVPAYEHVQMTALVKATNMFENQLVTWSVEDYGNNSSNIDQNGLLYTGGSAWKREITVTATADNGISDSCTLYVVYPTDSFSLPERITIQTGETLTVRPQNAYSNHYGDLTGYEYLQSYTMSVGTPDLAKTEGMELTGLAPGRTELTVTSWNGTEVKTEVLVYDPIETIDIFRIESLNGQYSVSEPKTDLFVQMNYRAHSKAISDKTYTDDLVTWTSSDPSVIRIEDATTGAFRTVKYGTATLTATAANGTVGTIELNVREEVKTFTLPETMTAFILADQELAAASITDPTAYDGFVWSISPAGLGTIDGQTLHVTTDTPYDGATLTATSWDGYVTKSTRLDIIRQPVTAIELEEYGNGEIGVGGDYEMTAHVTAGAEYVNHFVMWSSSDESIATVNENGVVHAVAGGEVTITATAEDNEDLYDSIDLTCVQGVESFTVTPEAITVFMGETAEVAVGDIEPENAIVREFTWTVSPAGIAAVEDGVITPSVTEDTEGVLTITSWNGTVREIPLHIVYPTISTAEIEPVPELSVGDTIQLTAHVTVNGEEYTNRFIDWESSDSNLSVNDEGILTANNQGTATITVKDHLTGRIRASVECVSHIALENFELYPRSYDFVPGNTEVTEYMCTIPYESITPYDAYADFTWTVESTAGQAEIVSSGMGGDHYCYYRYDGTKEAVITLTATNVNGVSRSVEIPFCYNSLYLCSEPEMDPDGMETGNWQTIILSAGEEGTIPLEAWNNGTELDISDIGLEYSSSNEETVTADETGKLTAVAKGKAVITVAHKYSNASIGIPVIVAEPVESFDLPSRILVPVGATIDLPVNNMRPATAGAEDLTWTIEPAGIAEVTGGTIKALTNNDAEATITAKSINGVTRTATLVVYAPYVDRIEFEEMPYAPMQEYVPIKVHAWADGVEYVNQLVTLEAFINSDYSDDWQNCGYGYFDAETGTIYSHWENTAYVRATAVNGEQATMEIRFMPKYRSFEFTKPVLLLKRYEGEYLRIKTYEPDGYDNSNVASYLIYETADETIATCRNDGYVYGHGETGTTTITARSINGVTNEVKVIVYREEDIDSIELSGVPQYAAIYQTIQLTATMGIYGETFENQLVTWESDNPRVASVNASGSVRTLGYGTATITATTPNGLTDSVVITVSQEPDNYTLPEKVRVTYGESITLAVDTVTPEDANMDITWTVEPAEAAAIEGNTLTALVNENMTAVLTATNWDGSVRTTALEIRRDLSTLQTMSLPALLTEIGEEAFANTGAQQIIIPNRCTTIGNRAFADSNTLLVIHIPASVNEIAANAFENSDNVVIYGDPGSYAKTFADAAGIPFLEE